MAPASSSKSPCDERDELGAERRAAAEGRAAGEIARPEAVVLDHDLEVRVREPGDAEVRVGAAADERALAHVHEAPRARPGIHAQARARPEHAGRDAWGAA